MRLPKLPLLTCEILTGPASLPAAEYTREEDPECRYIEADNGKMFRIRVSGQTGFDVDDGERYLPCVSITVDGMELVPAVKHEHDLTLPSPRGLAMKEHQSTIVTGLHFKPILLGKREGPLTEIVDNIGTIEVRVWSTVQLPPQASHFSHMLKRTRAEYENDEMDSKPDKPYEYEDFKKNFRTHCVGLATRRAIPSSGPSQAPTARLDRLLVTYTFKYRHKVVLEAFEVKDEAGKTLGGAPILRDNYPTIKDEDGRDVIHILDDD